MAIKKVSYADMQQTSSSFLGELEKIGNQITALQAKVQSAASGNQNKHMDAFNSSFEPCKNAFTQSIPDFLKDYGNDLDKKNQQI